MISRTWMPPAWSRILRLLFVVYVAATAIHIGWVVFHEPFGFDAWNIAVDTGAKPITPGRFFDYWWFEYTHSNPRFGQPFTYLAYKLEYFAVIATPLAYLAISLAVTVLGLGRWPWRRGRDLALWAIVIGSLWFALPQIGKTLFCRAYCANYVYGLAMQLWFLVPLRLATNTSRGKCVAYLAAGVIAGLCNEHTGPTLCAFLVGYAYWIERRTKQRPMLVWAGAIGAVIGFAMLFFAPGQGERYDGLAQRVTLLGRFLQRGFTGNVEILRDLVLGAAPVLGLILILAVLAISGDDPDDESRVRRRTIVRAIGIAMIAALAMAVTIFVSPKLGPRFYYGSICLLLAGFVALADLTAHRLWPFVVLAVASSIYAGGHTVPLYHRLAQASEARMAALARAKPGSIFFAESFEQIDETWWFLGDDFRDAKKRDMVATYFGLEGVVFHAFDANVPLGASGARLVPHYYQGDRSVCIEDDGGFSLGTFKGFDIAGLHHEIQVALALVQHRLEKHFERIDVAVELDDVRIVMPRPSILVGRWFPDRFEGYVGQIQRKGHATTREIAPAEESSRTPTSRS